MIMYRSSGNILDSTCRWITIPVNCVGTMGAGLAKGAAKKFPQQEKAYKQYCTSKELRIGVIKICSPLIFFPTKDNWRNPSELVFISNGLDALRRLYSASKGRLGSIAIPALGCGLGGLEWSLVKPLIEKYLGDLDIYVEVYVPQ